jgi:hypothetical protein
MVLKAVAISIAFLPLTILAQNEAAGSPGCGDDAVHFSVKTDKTPNSAKPEAGKALVYFIEDDSNFNSSPKPTTRAGLDGKWVGATHGNSHLFFSVDPGVHHLCASWQSGGSPMAGALIGARTGLGRKSSALSFTADAGGVYYFVAKNTYSSIDTTQTIDMSLTRLDGDDGQLRVNSAPLASSQQKK